MSCAEEREVNRAVEKFPNYQRELSFCGTLIFRSQARLSDPRLVSDLEITRTVCRCAVAVGAR